MKRSRLTRAREHAIRQWVFGLTTPGKYLFISTLFAMSIASSSLGVLAYHFFCALAGLAVVTYAAGWLLRPRLRVDDYIPRRAIAGQEAAGTLRITNGAGRSAYDVSAAMFLLPRSLRRASPEIVVPELPPGESATVPFALLPLRRGLYPLPPAWGYTTFPFNFLRTEARSPRGAPRPRDGTLLVYPHFHPVMDIDVPTNARYQPGGIALSSAVGESMEYIGNREYHPGDSPRRLDHRSWARLAKPVVKEFQEEYYCRVGLVLDTYVPGRRAPGPAGFPGVEAAISLGASVADALARGEYIIDIFAAGPELYVFRAGRATAHFENVLEILACVDACRTDPFAKIAPALQEELGSISSVICVLLDWDSSRERLVRAAFDAGCAVKILIVRDGPTTVPFAGHEAAACMQQFTPETIRGGGIEVL